MQGKKRVLRNKTCFIGTELDKVIITYVNQEFQEWRPNRNKVVFIGGLLTLQPWRHRPKKHLNCVPTEYKMREAYKGKKPQGYVNGQELGS